MRPEIKTALDHLDRANFHGFFQSLKNAVPPQHLTRYSALQGEFIAGTYPWNFEQQLRAFAALIAETAGGAPSNTSTESPLTPHATMTNQNRPLQIFLSFSNQEPKCEAYSKSIKKHLRTLIDKGQITIWGREDLIAGQEIKIQVMAHLEQADVFVALMSSDYFNDDEIYDWDFSVAQRRKTEGKLLVIPVILRAFNWEQTWLNDHAPLPRDRKPIQNPQNDEAWVELAEQLRLILEPKEGRRTAIVNPSSEPSSPAPTIPVPPTPPPIATPLPTSTTPPVSMKSPWQQIVQFLKDIPDVIKGIMAFFAAVGLIWAYLFPKAPDIETVTLKGELISATTGKPVNDLDIWIKGNKDLRYAMRPGGNTFSFSPVDPKMNNGQITLVVAFKGDRYADKPVESDVVNLNNFKAKEGVINIGEVSILEPLKSVPSPTLSPTRSSVSKPITLTGTLKILIPGKTAKDVSRVYLTDHTTNDDKNIDAYGTFKIFLEKPLADNLYKVSVVFRDSTSSKTVSVKPAALPNAKGELSLGTIPIER